MTPEETALRYNQIARWWSDNLTHSEYGLWQLDKAIAFCQNKRNALDIGCGSGGRFVNRLMEHGFTITGIDPSENMLEIARENHPGLNFINSSINKFETRERYDLIIAWDSIFHLPLNDHTTVIDKMCTFLSTDGILLYTFGNAIGEHESDWHQNKFYYSSIGINENINALLRGGCQILHLELDQFPEKHVFIIAKKTITAAA